MRRLIASFALCTLPLFASFPAVAQAQGFSTLKAASQGLNNSGKEDDKKEKKSNRQVDKSYRSAGPIGDAAGLNDLVFLGIFETYLTRQRQNARISLFVEPKKFALGYRACKKIVRLRDGVNTHLFMNPPKVDNKGRVKTGGMADGINTAIKQALKTDVDYFSKIHVIAGRFSAERLPKDLKGTPTSDCAGIKAKAKELENGA